VLLKQISHTDLWWSAVFLEIKFSRPWSGYCLRRPAYMRLQW
jgi:hypothetical protein